jgi:hypothetical protein
MRERDIESRLIDMAEKHRCFLRKLRWIGRNGAPDRLMIKPEGEVVFIELKAPGKRPAPLQEREHASLRRFGQVVRVLDSIESVEDLFK